MVCVEGRWQMLCHCDDEKLAMADAKKALASGKVQAVKVVQQRTMLVLGTTTERVIFEEKAPPPGERPISIASGPRDMSVCETVEDLFGPVSRRAIAQVMREYLAKMNLTPTELLYGWSHQKKLQDTGSLMLSAVQRIGTAQAQKTGEPARQRCNHLDGLIGQALQRARDFAAERKVLPAFDGKNVGAYSETIRGIVGERHDHVLLSQVTLALADRRGLMGKLEAVQEMVAENPPWPVGMLLDGVMSDFLCFPEVIKDLFGNQRNFGSFLTNLADLLANRPAAVERCPNAMLKAIVDGIHAGRLPQCREVLLDRLSKEVASDKPLDRLDPSADQRLMEKLADALKLADGSWLGGEEMGKAVETRRTLLRQQFLRSRGLTAIADNL